MERKKVAGWERDEYGGRLGGLAVTLLKKDRCVICNNPIPIYICPETPFPHSKPSLPNYSEHCAVASCAYLKVQANYFRAYSRREIKELKHMNRHGMYPEVIEEVERGTKHVFWGECRFKLAMGKGETCSKRCRDAWNWWYRWGMRTKVQGIDMHSLPVEERGLFILYAMLNYLYNKEVRNERRKRRNAANVKNELRTSQRPV